MTAGAVPRLFIVILLAGLGVACASAKPRVPEREGLAREHVAAYVDATRLLHSGDPDAAVDRITPFAMGGRHVATHVLRQDALLAADRRDEATLWYEQERDAHADDGVAVLLCARVCADEQERSAAYTRAAERLPDSAWPRVALAYDGLRRRAELSARSERELDRGYPQRSARLAAEAVAALVEAESSARAATLLQPDLRAARGALSDVLVAVAAHAERARRDEALKEARVEAQAALALDPAHPEPLARWGSLALADGDWIEAEDAFAAAVDAAPARAALWANLGRVRLSLREDAAALEALEQAVLLAPDDARIQQNLGVARFRADDLDGAIAAFERAGELDPENPRPFESLRLVIARRAESDAQQ